MLAVQLGESANELVARWVHDGDRYRYGFPDIYASGASVRPMNYDQSRIYSGVIGRHYPDAQTRRYTYLYDPNMYLQPGFSDSPSPITVTAVPSPLAVGTKVAIAAGITAAVVGAAIGIMAWKRHRAPH